MSAPTLVSVGRSDSTVFVVFTEDIARVNAMLPWDNGFALEANGVTVAIDSVVKVTNGIWLSVAAPFVASAVVQVTYSGVNLIDAATTTDLVEAFASTAPLGEINQSYPQSTVTSSPLSISGNSVTAQLSVSLNSIDREVVTRYAPTFDQGGNFGLPTVSPPTGFAVPSRQLTIKDGQTYSYTFVVPGNTLWASLAAADWLAEMVLRIGASLNAARLTDQSISFGTLTVTKV